MEDRRYKYTFSCLFVLAYARVLGAGQQFSIVLELIIDSVFDGFFFYYQRRRG